MAIVTNSELRSFIETYLGTFQLLISGFPQENRKIFPPHLVLPYKIVGTISTVHGVAIEFLRETRKRQIEVKQTTRRIEDVVLPRTSGLGLMFRVIGKQTIIATLTLDVGEKGRFVDVVEGGDVKFIGVRFLSIFKRRPQSKIVDCLWIFGSNLPESWTLENAQRRAAVDFSWFMASFMLELRPKTLKENLRAQETMLEKIRTDLSELKQLVNKRVKEEEMKQFLMKNQQLLKLCFHIKTLYPEFRLGEVFQVDFVAECYDGQYLLTELESPTDKLYTAKGRSKELRDALQQVEDYQRWIGEHVGYVKDKLPNITPTPKGLVIIGRKKSLSSMDKKRLNKLNETLHRIEVLTFDDIIELVELVLENLKP